MPVDVWDFEKHADRALRMTPVAGVVQRSSIRVARLSAHCWRGNHDEAREEVALLRKEWESLSHPGPYGEAIGSVLGRSMPYRDLCVELDTSVTLAVEAGAASCADIAKPIRRALMANGHTHAMAENATGAALALNLYAEHQARGAAGAAAWLDGLREDGNLGGEHPTDFFSTLTSTSDVSRSSTAGMP